MLFVLYRALWLLAAGLFFFFFNFFFMPFPVCFRIVVVDGSCLVLLHKKQYRTLLTAVH